MKKRFSLLWHEATRLIGNASRSSVAQNAVSLYIIQFANYILPLITVPYLVRVLGPTEYGVVAFAQSFISFFVLFADYGFAFSATRNISVERNDPIAVSRTVFNVWGAKILLAGTGFTVLLLLVTVIPKLSEVATLLVILYGMVIGNVLFPVWLFQGMEKMVAISVIYLTMNFLVAIGIFTMIHRPEDYLLYAGLISFGFMGAGLAGALAALFMFKLRPVFPSSQGVWKVLVEGWMLFLSSASISLYGVGNAFILGILTNHTIVGYYSAAEKITKVVVRLLDPISQAAYPRFSKLASDSKALALEWGRRMLLSMSWLALVLSILLFVGAPLIVRIVLGSGYEPSTTVVRILAALPLLIGVSNVLGVQIMFPFKQDKAVLVVVFAAGLINLTLAMLLTPKWSAAGMATAVLISETFVTVGFLIYLWASHLVPIGKARAVDVQCHREPS